MLIGNCVCWDYTAILIPKQLYVDLTNYHANSMSFCIFQSNSINCSLIFPFNQTYMANITT